MLNVSVTEVVTDWYFIIVISSIISINIRSKWVIFPGLDNIPLDNTITRRNKPT